MAKFSAAQQKAILNIFSKRILAAAYKAQERSTTVECDRQTRLKADLELLYKVFEDKAQKLLSKQKAIDVVQVSIQQGVPAQQYKSDEPPHIVLRSFLNKDFLKLKEELISTREALYEQHGGRAQQLTVHYQDGSYNTSKTFLLIPAEYAFIQAAVNRRESFELELVLSGTGIDFETVMQSLGI